jgi:serine/threonine-protein kinase
VLALTTAWWALGGRTPTGAEPVRSIAVLPFHILNGDSTASYLGDGVSEEILTALSRLPGLVVVGRASSFRFRGTDIDARRIGRELDASALLTGSLQRSGDAVRVSAELVDTRTGRQLWAQTLDRPMRDLFALEDEIARAITDALRVRLAGGAVVRPGTTSPEAHDLALRAAAFQRQADEPSLESAVTLYRQALLHDSTYARAWAGLSMSYGLLADAHRSPVAMVPLAEHAALRAVALDDSLAIAHVALAQVRCYWQWRFADARRELQHALALDPSSSEAHLTYAIYLEFIAQDLDGAERELQAAVASDPFNPAIALRQMSVAQLKGDDERALRLAKRAAELSGLPVYYDNALAAGLHAAAGRWEACVRGFDSLPPVRPAGRSELAICHAHLGDTAAARGIMRQLLARRYTDAVRLAEIQLALGDRAAALASLERAVDDQSSNLISVRSLHLLAPLRNEPRFLAVLRRVGLPPQGPPPDDGSR